MKFALQHVAVFLSSSINSFGPLKALKPFLSQIAPVYTCLCWHSVSRLSNGSRSGSVFRMKAKELHFLHGRPRRAVPEGSDWLRRFTTELWGLDGWGGGSGGCRVWLRFSCPWTGPYEVKIRDWALRTGSSILVTQQHLIPCTAHKSDTFWPKSTCFTTNMQYCCHAGAITHCSASYFNSTCTLHGTVKSKCVC